MNAIEVRDVHKVFRIPHERHTTLTERALNLFQRGSFEEFHALRGVDLTVPRGSCVGIIGANGSGKSTLLKIIAGLLPPDSGSVHVSGSMSAILELGLGFSPELTVRENVELYAALLGYPQEETTERVQRAIEFAELDRFRDTKLKNLSTGMVMRLGFATALQAETEILLLDEVFAVGDAAFQRKCIEMFAVLKRQSRTILMVSHDLEQVRRFCDQAIYLSEGRCAAVGSPGEVIACYLDAVQRMLAPNPELAVEDTRPLRLLDCRIEDLEGNRVSTARPAQRLLIRVDAVVVEDAPKPRIGIWVWKYPNIILQAFHADYFDPVMMPIQEGQNVSISIPFAAPYSPGTIMVMILASQERPPERPYNSALLSVQDDEGEALEQSGFAIRISP